MSNFVLIVDFEVRADSVDRFIELISENAQKSVDDEPGCLQFDVVRSQSEPTRVTLYEVYADAAAFDVHKTMPHVAAFFGAAKGLIVKQAFHQFDRLHAS